MPSEPPWDRTGIARLALLAPLIFVVHVLEEAPRFVAWFNSLVARGITQRMFLNVNATALVITVVVVALVVAEQGQVTAILALAWFGLLMLANGLFHIVATVVHSRYSPGVVTAILLYLPYFFAFAMLAVRRLKVSVPIVVTAALLGGLPMLIHGYLIVFRGSRLF
jgi:hypothetical protein